MFREVILHIGMSKCGSTAIQKFLASREVTLAKKGICYPRVGRVDGAHFGLLDALVGGTSRVWWDSVRREAGDADVLILSCEGLWHQPTRVIREIKSLLSSCEVKVVLYLRHPGDYLASSYRQQIKRMRCRDSKMTFLGRIGSRIDYPKVICNWRRAFRLDVSCYELAKKSLVCDFLNRAGVTGLEFPRGDFRQNETPNDGVTRLIFLANLMLPKRLLPTARAMINWSERSLRFLPAIDNEVFYDFAWEQARLWDIQRVSESLHVRDREVITDFYARNRAVKDGSC